MTPVRIQRSRQHKQISPNGLPIKYCGRGSKWGNPFRLVKYPNHEMGWGVKISNGNDERQRSILISTCRVCYPDRESAAKDAIKCYAEYILPYTHDKGLNEFFISDAVLEDMKRDLAGKNLSCWCKLNETCHVDWLLKTVNNLK